jgi:predicted O-linked N-acetylglucosamine transferase (SPINDLY family)
LSDEAAAGRIRQDEIDVLIDLNGLTSGSRLHILR